MNKLITGMLIKIINRVYNESGICIESIYVDWESPRRENMTGKLLDRKIKNLNYSVTAHNEDSKS